MTQEIRKELVALLPRLRRFAYSITGTLDEAEDVLQSACEKALGRLGQFEPGTRLDSWMFQIIRTVAIDRARYNGRRKTFHDPVATANLAFDARTHEQLAARLDLEIIRDEIDKLPEEQRAVLGLVTIEGMSYQDAAGILAIPIGTVMSRLARARRKLAEALETSNRTKSSRPTSSAPQT